MLTIPKTFLLLKIVPTSRNNINSINISLQYCYSLHPLQWGCRGGIGRVSTIVVRTSSMSRAASRLENSTDTPKCSLHLNKAVCLLGKPSFKKSLIL